MASPRPDMLVFVMAEVLARTSATRPDSEASMLKPRRALAAMLAALDKSIPSAAAISSSPGMAFSIWLDVNPARAKFSWL